MTINEAIEGAKSFSESRHTVVVYSTSTGYGYCSASHFLVSGVGKNLPVIAAIEPDGSIQFNESITAPECKLAEIPESVMAEVSAAIADSAGSGPKSPTPKSPTPGQDAADKALADRMQGMVEGR